MERAIYLARSLIEKSDPVVQAALHDELAELGYGPGVLRHFQAYYPGSRVCSGAGCAISSYLAFCIEPWDTHIYVDKSLVKPDVLFNCSYGWVLFAGYNDKGCCWEGVKELSWKT
jgi:hypothetical protein